jgi:hypothetical protein
MIPKLDLVDISTIRPMTGFDTDLVEYYSQVIASGNRFRNPVALMEKTAEEFYLLDDSAILEAVKKLNVDLVPAQVVDSYNMVAVQSHGYLGAFNSDDLSTFAASFPRDCRLENSGNRQGLGIRIIGKDNVDRYIYFKTTDNHILPFAWFEFMAYLKKRYGVISNILPSHNGSAGNLKTISFGGWFEIFGLTWEEIRATLASGRLLPSNIFSFDFTNRLLGINYPLVVLQSSVAFEEKQRFLYDLVNLRIRSGDSRYYPGGVYLLGY